MSVSSKGTHYSNQESVFTKFGMKMKENAEKEVKLSGALKMDNLILKS